MYCERRESAANAALAKTFAHNEGRVDAPSSSFSAPPFEARWCASIAKLVGNIRQHATQNQ
jgi:hypothetical protein